MVKEVKITGLKKVRREIQKKIRKIETDKGLLDAIGAIATKSIKATVRAGKDPQTNKRFTKLADSTIKSRKSYARSSKRKSPSFKPTFSNLTRTGQMVRNIFVTIKGNKIKIAVRATSRSDSDLTNQALADIHEEGGGNLPSRNVFGLPGKTQKKIIKALQIFLNRRLK